MQLTLLCISNSSVTCRSTKLASDDDYSTYELSHVNSLLVTTRHGIS